MANPVSQPDPTAVFGRRVVAAILDALLVLIPTVALFTSNFEYATEAEVRAQTGLDGADFCDARMEDTGGFCVDFSDVDDNVYYADGVSGATTAVAWGIPFLLFVILQGLTGWTPGKLVMGLRTVKADGTIVGIPKAFIRWILLIVDGQPCGLPLVGFITGLTTQGHRRVGDMAAKTFVVRAAAVGSPIQVPGMALPPSATGWGTPAPTPTGGWGAAAPTPPAGGWGALVPPPAGSDASNAGWAAPSSPAEPVAPAAAPAAPAPQWDEARGAYIQFDPAQGAWLQWDDATQQWNRIAGQ